jgi:hypothetical protein
MSARDEALRLWKEVGGKAFDNEMFTEMDINDLMGLIALARQRPGWTWIPNSALTVGQQAMYNKTPKPGDGT